VVTGPELVLCDDHPVFIDALGAVLGRQGFAVQAIVHRTAQIEATVARYRPDGCLIDRNFGDGDGLDMIAPVLAASPSTKVLMLTADRDEATARRAMAAGASGYLCKTAGLSALLTTVRRVLAGSTTVDIGARAAVRRSPEDAEAHRLAGYLTNREWECLELLVGGYSSVAIAARLGVSVTTVRSHVQSVLTKLGVHSRLEAASFAVRHSLVSRSA
jgi:two-component system, NarL family, nitrate/nitrite response regulator NarL